MLGQLEKLTIKQFGALFTLRILDASLVEEFLKRYSFAKGVFINNPDWIIFLNEVISRCQGARNHLFLITYFLWPAFDSYTREEHCELFLNDLLEVSHKVHGLLALGNKENSAEERSRVLHGFKEFLTRMITMGSLLYVISAEHEFYNVSLLNGYCNFNYI